MYVLIDLGRTAIGVKLFVVLTVRLGINHLKMTTYSRTRSGQSVHFNQIEVAAPKPVLLNARRTRTYINNCKHTLKML